jgi:hypothetical protein
VNGRQTFDGASATCAPPVVVCFICRRRCAMTTTRIAAIDAPPEVARGTRLDVSTSFAPLQELS